MTIRSRKDDFGYNCLFIYGQIILGLTQKPRAASREDMTHLELNRCVQCSVFFFFINCLRERNCQLFFYITY